MWHNTIHLSVLKSVDKVLHYENDVHMGANVPFADDIDLSSVPLGCLLIIVDINNWLEEGKFPSDIIHMSLSEDHGPDNFVLVMMAATNPMRVEDGQKLWDHDFVNCIKSTLNLTMKGDGSAHFKSLGKYFGFGYMAKSNLSGICSYGRIKVKKMPNQRT